METSGLHTLTFLDEDIRESLWVIISDGSFRNVDPDKEAPAVVVGTTFDGYVNLLEVG